MEAYTSTLSLLAYSLICPHNAFVFHLKLVPGFRACYILNLDVLNILKSFKKAF